MLDERNSYVIKSRVFEVDYVLILLLLLEIKVGS